MFFHCAQDCSCKDGEEAQDGDGWGEADAVVGEDDVEDDSQEGDQDHRDEQSTGELDGFVVLCVLVMNPLAGLVEQGRRIGGVMLGMVGIGIALWHVRTDQELGLVVMVVG